MRRGWSFPSGNAKTTCPLVEDTESKSCASTPHAMTSTPYPRSPKFFHKPAIVGRFFEALSEASSMLRSMFQLIRMIGFGFMSYFMFIRLVLFSVFIWPTIIPLAIWWSTSKRVLRAVRYGDNPRNFLDVYLPEGHPNSEKLATVIVGVTGGAWILGNKAWLAGVAKRVCECDDCIFISVDYRNFPQGSLPDMLVDVSTALDWIFASLTSLGGDSAKVQLLGQSAGAHLLALLLLRHPGRWRVQRFFALSGPFDLVKLLPRLNARGLNTRMLAAILGGDVFAASPIRGLTQNLRLPPFRLYHGTKDVSVPLESSLEFSRALNLRGFDCHLTVLHDMTHSEPLLEGPLRGNHTFADLIVAEIGAVVHAKHNLEKPALWRIFLIKIAQFFMPF